MHVWRRFPAEAHQQPQLFSSSFRDISTNRRYCHHGHVRTGGGVAGSLFRCRCTVPHIAVSVCDMRYTMRYTYASDEVHTTSATTPVVLRPYPCCRSSRGVGFRCDWLIASRWMGSFAFGFFLTRQKAAAPPSHPCLFSEANGMYTSTFLCFRSPSGEYLVFDQNPRLKVSPNLPGYDWLAGEGVNVIAGISLERFHVTL